MDDFLRRDDGYDRIYDIIGRYFPGNAKYYLSVDFPRFNMLSDQEEEWGYFIDAKQVGTPIREHEEIRPLWHETKETARLFVPREVVEDLHKLIG